MGNPLADQLLKAGLVTKKQVQKAQQEKHRQKKKQPKKARSGQPDEAQHRAQKAAEEKARRDRELNLKKEQQARAKAISIEINQLITDNCLERDENCDIPYHFEHNKKVRRVYVNQAMKQQIIAGKLGIARIEGRYELVPLATAEKIKQRNAKRIVIFEEEETPVDEAYAGYEVPDDLVW